MKYCKKCGTTLEESAKFCTKCGTKVSTTEKQSDTTNIPIEAKKNNPNKKKIMIVIGIIIIIALVFVGRGFLSSSNTSGPLFDIDEEVGKIEGNWYDPNGLLLNDKATIINFTVAGSLAHGSDQNDILDISLIPIDKNKYYATANLNDDENEFDATYNPEENIIFFVSKKTKTKWQLNKVKE